MSDGTSDRARGETNPGPHLTEDRTAILAGAAAFLVVLALGYLCLELVYGEAATRDVVSAVQSSALYFGGALLTASVTIGALMLNALGTARQLEAEFEKDVFRRIYRVAIYATALLGTATALMLLLCLPVEELSGVPESWYAALYHALMALLALAVGVVTLTGVELFRTVRCMMHTVLADDR